MKTYVLTVSRVFPTTHKRKGEPTFFVEKIFKGLNQIMPCCWCGHGCTCSKHCIIDSMNLNEKLHTIRANYELWAKRIKDVQEGKAILSIRYWSGKPYNSKQVEICQLDKDSGIGIQKLITLYDSFVLIGKKENEYDSFSIKKDLLAKNDGLSLEDFKEWFRKYDLSNPMAIIHFTSFRY